MEILGKVTDIVLNRKGVSKTTGNAYEVYTVAIEGNDKVAADVYGTREHLEKNGIKIGAEGKFTIITNVRKFTTKDGVDRLITDISFNPQYDFKPLGGRKEQKQGDAVPVPTEDEKKVMDLLGVDLTEAKRIIAEKKKKNEAKAEQAAQVATEGDPLPF